MKKLLTAVATFVSLASYTAPSVYAQSIKLCPEGSQFEKLCTGLGPSSFGGIVYAVIVILLIVAVILALVFLIWGGIKWILSGGDKTNVEGARNQIVGAIVGLIIAFVSFFIIVIIGQIFQIELFHLSLPTPFNQSGGGSATPTRVPGSTGP